VREYTAACWDCSWHVSTRAWCTCSYVRSGKHKKGGLVLVANNQQNHLLKKRNSELQHMTHYALDQLKLLQARIPHINTKQQIYNEAAT